MNKDFEIATIKANEVICKLDYDNDGLVKTENVFNIVLSVMNEEMPTEIECFYLSFNKSNIDEDYGAMMCVLEDEEKNKRRVTIVVNSDKDPKFQRFSLIHELGHLITGHYNVVDKENHYTVSAHIKYNITTISDEQCQKNEHMKNEQIANIFALKVLMPFDAFAQKLFESDDLQTIADFFGVTKDAVRSRSLLGI